MRSMSTIKHIRKNVFKATQADFAVIAGVTQATVSRWENEELSPDLSQMEAIRAAARRKRLRWDDRLFFELPVKKEVVRAGAVI